MMLIYIMKNDYSITQGRTLETILRYIALVANTPTFGNKHVEHRNNGQLTLELIMMTMPFFIRL